MGLDPAYEQLLIARGMIEPRSSPPPQPVEVQTSAPAERKPARGDATLTASESEIQSAVLRYLALCGAVAVRVNSGGMHIDGRYVRFNDTPGCSDILACLPCRGSDTLACFAAIEVKRPGNKPTEKQQWFLNWVTRVGGVSMVVTSVNDLASQLRERGFYAP